ncbi:MAG: S41 family peptidase [Bacillota bacterium]|nr:S41 family peptidase [Bacillota bacterium]
MKKNNKLTLQQKHARKRQRKQLLTTIVAIVLIILFVASMASPLFALSQDEEKKIDGILNLIETQYYKKYERHELMNQVYKAILEAGDPHSTYMTIEEYDRWKTSLTGNFFGIGAYIGVDESKRIRIDGVIESTPAERVGLKAGDIVVAIDGTLTEGMSVDQVVTRIRGDKGTIVTLRILRAKQLIEYRIKRDEIRIKAVRYEVLPTGEGYIKFSQFSDGSAAEMREALFALQRKGVERLILDLRGNGGGYLREAIAIADMFVGRGKMIVKTAGAHHEGDSYQAQLPRTPMKLAVLIDEASASASEILAGAIKQNKEGILIGTNSYGKGTVQNLLELYDGSVVKLTIAEYLLAGDVQVNGVGVKPDIEAEGDAAIEAAKKALLKGFQSTSVE